MKVTVYKDATAFLDKVRVRLEEQELINSTMIGVAERVAAGFAYGNEPPYFATVETDGNLRVIAAMTPPFNLQIYSENGPDLAVFEAIAKNLLESGQDITGVLGQKGLPEAFAGIWEGLTGKKGQLNKQLRLFSLTEVIPPPPCPGNFRLATLDDAELLGNWMEIFELEALGRVELADPHKAVHQRIQDSSLFVWEDKGQVVAMTGQARPTKISMTVNAVYTPPEFRGKGYASNLVAQVSRTILEAGKPYCVLYTDQANPTSNSIYQKIGYRSICDFDEYRFD